MSEYYSFKNIRDAPGFFLDVQQRIPSIASVEVNGEDTSIAFSQPLSSTQQSLLSNSYIASYIVDNYKVPYESLENSTYGPLAGNATFNGVYENVSGYNLVYLNVKASMSMSDALHVHFSNDTTHTITTQSFDTAANIMSEMVVKVPSSSNGNIFARTSLSNVYSTNLSLLDLHTFYLREYHKDTQKFLLRSTVGDNDKCVLNKSVLSGKHLGIYNDVAVTAMNELRVDVPTSAFGLLKVQEDIPHVQVTFQYGIPAMSTLTTTSGSGYVTSSNSLAIVGSGAASNSEAILESTRIFKYSAGQGGNIMFTALFDPPVEGNIRVIGIGSDTNGFGFGYNGLKFGIVRRSNAVQNWTYQADWNIDKMDGTGPSGQYLNHAKGNVYRISFQWLGFGAICFFIEEASSGRFFLVHREAYANKNTVPSVLDPSFKFRMRSTNTTNTTDVSLKTACFCAMSEGVKSILGPTFCADNTKTISSTTMTNILTIRNKSVYKGVSNFIPIYPKMFSASTEGTKSVVFYILKSPSIAGTQSWVDIKTDGSPVEYDFTGGAVSGGVVVAAFTYGKVDTRAHNINDLNLYLEPQQWITIAAKVVSAGSSDVTASMIWLEDH